MAFDAFFLSAVLAELREKALGARVEKIHQPARDTLVLLLRCEGGRRRLVITPNPTAPRLYLTEGNPENPAQPPMFCMLLRKHLSGAKLTGITQLPMERAAEFTFACVDELGDEALKKLVVELMGRTCNLYLVDRDGRILDCLRRVGLDETGSGRPALPGLTYQPPEPVKKSHPLDLTEEMLLGPGPDLLSDRLMDCLGGLSPLVCREAALYAGGETDTRLSGQDPQALTRRLLAFFGEHLTHPAPYYTSSGGKIRQFAFCPLSQYGEFHRAETFSGLLDQVYSVQSRADAMGQKSQTVRKHLTTACQRLQRKLAVQEKELEATYDRERLRQLGDIVTANLHRIVKGQTVLSAEDFYDEDMKTVEIPLSPLLSPQQNAAKYYKDYTRMKNAEKELKRQLALGREELEYLKSVLDELSRVSTEGELEEIRQELAEGGYLRRDGEKKRMKQARLSPMRFLSTDGTPIFVGRNNRQNDDLTFRAARKDEIWLHAQKVPGSHVIIASSHPSDDTVTQTAQLAAYYSQAGAGQNVSVDVTPVKQVKKLPGAKPGMVIYHTYRTVIANPYPDIVVDELNKA